MKKLIGLCAAFAFFAMVSCSDMPVGTDDTYSNVEMVKGKDQKQLLPNEGIFNTVVPTERAATKNKSVPAKLPVVKLYDKKTVNDSDIPKLDDEISKLPATDENLKVLQNKDEKSGSENQN